MHSVMAMIECAVPACLHFKGASLCRTVNQSLNGWMELKPKKARTFMRLWDRYFQRLVRLAAAKLPGHCRRTFDEEDVVLTRVQSFCNRAGQGQFPQLAGRDELWRLLAMLTVRKAAPMVRHQTRQKRGGGRVLGESGLQPRRHTANGSSGLVDILGKEPTPEARPDLPIHLSI